MLPLSSVVRRHRCLCEVCTNSYFCSLLLMYSFLCLVGFCISLKRTIKRIATGDRQTAPQKAHRYKYLLHILIIAFIIVYLYPVIYNIYFVCSVSCGLLLAYTLRSKCCYLCFDRNNIEPHNSLIVRPICEPDVLFILTASMPCIAYSFMLHSFILTEAHFKSIAWKLP